MYGSGFQICYSWIPLCWEFLQHPFILIYPQVSGLTVLPSLSFPCAVFPSLSFPGLFFPCLSFSLSNLPCRALPFLTFTCLVSPFLNFPCLALPFLIFPSVVFSSPNLSPSTLIFHQPFPVYSVTQSICCLCSITSPGKQCNNECVPSDLLLRKM